MNLRVRLALILAALVTTAVGLAAVVGYLTSARRLEAEIDRTLADRSAEFVSLFEGPLRGPPGDRRGPAMQGIPDEIRSRYRVELPRFLRLDAVVQFVDENGAVVGRGEVELPVGEPERAVAGAGVPAVALRTVDVDGVPYRMRTVAAAGGAVQVARDYRETLNVLASLRDRFLLIGLIGAIGAAAMGWLVARQVTRPLEQLTAAAETVARTGRLDAPVPPGRKDETGRLAASFSTMLAALASSRDQQAQLVQDAGHELRTPVTSLRTNAEVLRRYPSLAPEQRDRILADIDIEARELGQLVDELVLLASGAQDETPPEPVELAAVVGTVVERMRRRTGRDIVVTLAGPAEVTGRPPALERAVGNLIDNAAKFAPDGPIEVAVTGGRVEVRDRGPGFVPGEEQRVFERFHRAEAARALPGSGLGLAIVAQIVEAHGGTVFAANRADGPGATAGFELPVLR